MEPTILKLKTESDEGPIQVIVDDKKVLTLDLKATPGIFHVVIPHEYRMKEVSHTSPELGEGVHYAVMLNYTQIEKKFLEKELKEVRVLSDQRQRILDAKAQHRTTNKSEGEIPPLLEVWDAKKEIWKPELWLNLKEGMRCRERDTLSGVLIAVEEGRVNWMCAGTPQCVGGIWNVAREMASFPDYISN